MKCSDIEKQLELFIPKGLAQTDKKENTGLIVGRSDKCFNDYSCLSH